MQKLDEKKTSDQLSRGHKCIQYGFSEYARLYSKTAVNFRISYIHASHLDSHDDRVITTIAV